MARKLKQSRARKRGFPVTIYFTHAEESVVDEIQALVEYGKLKTTKGQPFASFSEFIREAMNEKLIRSKADG
jgi:hypothetical protein